MKYCIVTDGIITNVISSDKEFAETIGAMPSYEGAKIGDAYNPPPPEPSEQDDIAAMLVDHELRIAMMELEIGGDA